MNLKRIILTSLLITWMIVIFMFSNQNATKSESTSDKVTSTVIDTVEVVTKEEITEDKKEVLIEDTRFVVRKTAHFTLYFILGVLTYLTLKSYSIKKIVIFSILLCFIYSCSDEIHQMFLDGRTAKILDIFIDTIGSIVGISLCIIICKLKSKYNNSKTHKDSLMI